jgi:hypothetical protein
MVTVVLTSLHWQPEAVANLMAHNKIDNRCELSKRLRGYGITRATIYRTFDTDWGGRATGTMLAVLAHFFRVPLAQLVAEPAER